MTAILISLALVTQQTQTQEAGQASEVRLAAMISCVAHTVRYEPPAGSINVTVVSSDETVVIKTSSKDYKVHASADVKPQDVIFEYTLNRANKLVSLERGPCRANSRQGDDALRMEKAFRLAAALPGMDNVIMSGFAFTSGEVSNGSLLLLFASLDRTVDSGIVIEVSADLTVARKLRSSG